MHLDQLENRDHSFLPLSKSPIWDLQSDYFHNQGIEAWRQNIVPSYVTSNPFIAYSYAQMALAFIQDMAPCCSSHQPIYLLELGAGSGRFAYHFLRAFFEQYGEESQRKRPVCYVMSDISEANIHFWEEHEQLQPYVEQGKLDFARFNPVEDDALKLRKAKILLNKNTLKQPLVCIANYFFDSVQQDIFEVKDGKWYECLVSMGSKERISTSADGEKTISSTRFTYKTRPCKEHVYEDPLWNRLLTHYKESLTETTLLFPVAGLRCLERLSELSKRQLLLLTADRGQHSLEGLERLHRPQPSAHGDCFSLSVNYHALGYHICQLGGVALQPSHLQRSLSINAFLQGTIDFTNTRSAYQQYIDSFGPDDFFAIKKGMDRHYSQLSLAELRGLLRLSRWDSNILIGCCERLLKLLSMASESERQDFRQILQFVEDQHFFLKEKRTLDHTLAKLYTELGDYVRAAHHYRQVR